MKTIELLVPAKDLETGIAAVNCGADAVYIGASSFGARCKAGNSLEDIKKLVDYAHKFYVRIHVTMNTILNESELEQAIELVQNLYDIGIDAIIVQDMGLIKAAIDGKLPPIQIHASTQCNNRTLEKVKFFDNIGLSRVVMARELSIEHIKEICDKTNCEIETFIHGALCVSYSGQCYLSYANGKRSANRGECAQPCRKKYSLIDEDGKIIQKDKYLLSLKDFNASGHIKQLIDAGVNSFKVEGRLKDINYVKNIPLYYNKLLSDIANRTSSGQVTTNIVPNPNKTFNRGYTDYFLQNRQQCFNFLSPKSRGEKVGKVLRVCSNFFETDAQLNPQDGICFIKDGQMKGFLVNKVEGKRVYPNKMNDIKTGMTLYRNFDFKFEKELNNAEIVRKIGVVLTLNKNQITAKDENGNIAEIELPQGQIPQNVQKAKDTFLKQIKKTGAQDFYIKEIINNIEDIAFYPISQINELRRNLFEELMTQRLKNYPKLSQNKIKYHEYPDKKLDYRANIMNKEAETFYKNCGCDTCDKALELSAKIPQGIELMRTKHCLKYANNLCQKPSKKLFLTDEKGKKYPLKFDCKNCEMVILSP